MTIALFGKPFFFGDSECPSPSAVEGIDVNLEGFDGMSDLSILEWVFRATNAPADALSDRDMGLIDDNKAVLSGRLWSISVGDVIAIDGRCYVCDSCGWYQTSKSAAAAYFDIHHGERGQFGNRWPVPQGFESEGGLLVDRLTKGVFVSAQNAAVAAAAAAAADAADAA